jgi:hypothetical protein
LRVTDVPTDYTGLMHNQTRTAATTTQVTAASVIAGLAMLCAAQARFILTRIAALYPTTLPEHPYFIPAHGALLYIGAGVAVAACVAALLAPGMLFTLAIGGERRSSAFLLKSFAASFALRYAMHSAALGTIAERMTFGLFMTLDFAIAIPLAIVAIWRTSAGEVQWPLSAPGQTRRFVTALITPAVLVTALIPLFFWQDLTGDGMEALETGYSLTWHVLPRFPTAFGFGRVEEGMLAMAVPTHWFVQFLGPIEASARLPLALYLPVLYAGLLELIEWKAPRPLQLGEEGVLVLALATYAVAMCFNSTFDPYRADIASPGAAMDTLTAVCLAGTILFIWQRKLLWLSVFVAIGMMARPIEMIMLGGLALGTVIAGGDERKEQLRYIAWGLALCLTIWIAHDILWLRYATGSAHVGGQLVRWQYLTLTDANRLLYAAIPGGLLPFFSLALWNKQDREARQLTVACVAYFLMFYVQAFIALHHFVPVMLLPIVVFWRARFRFSAAWPTGLAAAATAVSLWLSLPRRFELHRPARTVGCETVYLPAQEDLSNWAAHPVKPRQRRLLGTLFSLEGGLRPEENLLLTPGPILYYAMRCRTQPSAAQYLVLAVNSPPPAGAVRIAGDTTASLFVRDTTAWQRERRQPPPTDWRSSVFAIPRETLHLTVGVKVGNYQIDLGGAPLIGKLFRE